MELVVLLLVIGTSIWVYLDATKIGVRKTGEKPQTGKFHVDMGPVGWLVCCLMIWIIAFPVYLKLRPKYVKMFQPVRPASSQPTPALAPFRQPMDFDEQLRKLAKLKQDGIISEEDFETKKKEILGNESLSNPQPSQGGDFPVPPAPQTDRGSSGLRTFGTLLSLGGLAAAGYFFLVFDTSVQVGSVSVNNLGLMADRQNGILVGIGLGVVGTIMLVMARVKRINEY